MNAMKIFHFKQFIRFSVFKNPLLIKMQEIGAFEQDSSLQCCNSYLFVSQAGDLIKGEIVNSPATHHLIRILWDSRADNPSLIFVSVKFKYFTSDINDFTSLADLLLKTAVFRCIRKHVNT